jgi:hypothetical protein
MASTLKTSMHVKTDAFTSYVRKNIPKMKPKYWAYLVMKLGIPIIRLWNCEFPDVSNIF